MLITLWNYLRGYVIIEVTGFSVERFVNLAVHKGVYIWDAVYTQDGVTMRVSIKAFKLLRSCAKKTKCRIRITNKIGCPFVAHRYRKRKILAFGLLFFLSMMYLLSTFVWLIDVQGNDRVPTEDILDYCEANGLSNGVRQRNVDPKAIEKGILNTFGDISWVNIYLDGTKATISVTETIPQQKIVDRKAPCNIIASKDALITDIYTSAGTPLVKEKDVVHKGDVLVSGELLVKEDETGTIKEYVHSDATVLGKNYHEMAFEVPYNYVEKQYTGKTNKDYGVIVFGHHIQAPHGKAPYENFDKTMSRKQLKMGENYPLPIIFTVTEYKEFTPVVKSRTPEQAKELGERMVNSRIIREFDFEVDIIDKEVSFVENGDESVTVNALITTVEDIGVEEVLVPPVEEPDQEELPMEGDVPTPQTASPLPAPSN